MYFLLITVTFLTAQAETFKKLNSDKEWEKYKKDFNLNFENEENELRKSIFLKNIEFIDQHNKKDSLFKLGINHYTHLVFIFFIRQGKNSHRDQVKLKK